MPPRRSQEYTALQGASASEAFTSIDSLRHFDKDLSDWAERQRAAGKLGVTAVAHLQTIQDSRDANYAERVLSDTPVRSGGELY